MFAMLPLAQAATGDAAMIGTWNFSKEKRPNARPMVGSLVIIEQTGTLWTITLGYGPNVLTVFKCTGDGSACTVEVEKRQEYACQKASWEGKKLLIDCTWVNGMNQKASEPWVFVIEDGMLTISRSGRVEWFAKQ